MINQKTSQIHNFSLICDPSPQQTPAISPVSWWTMRGHFPLLHYVFKYSITLQMLTMETVRSWGAQTVFFNGFTWGGWAEGQSLEVSSIWARERVTVRQLERCKHWYKETGWRCQEKEAEADQKIFWISQFGKCKQRQTFPFSILLTSFRQANGSSSRKRMSRKWVVSFSTEQNMKQQLNVPACTRCYFSDSKCNACGVFSVIQRGRTEHRRGEQMCLWDDLVAEAVTFGTSLLALTQNLHLSSRSPVIQLCLWLPTVWERMHLNRSAWTNTI